MESQATSLINSFYDMTELLQEAKDAGQYPPKEFIVSQLIDIAARCLIVIESLTELGESEETLKQHLVDLLAERMRISD